MPRKQPPSSAPVRHLGRNASHLNLPPPPWSARHRLTSTVASLLASKAAKEDMKDTIKHAASELSLVPAECKVLSEIRLNLIPFRSVLPTGKVILSTLCGSQLLTNNAVEKKKKKKNICLFSFFFSTAETACAPQC